MSKLKEQLDVDILRFLENIENQSQNSKIQTLRDLFDKYLHLNSCDFIMDAHDLNCIISDAKNKFSTAKMPIHLGQNKRLVRQSELPNLCVIEATIGHLSKKDCLKKIPKFDKREDKL